MNSDTSRRSEGMPTGAQPEYRKDVPPTWDHFTQHFADAPGGYSDAWREVGVWAVERLREHLGRDWPARTFVRHGRLPGGMSYAITHRVAYFELVQLALWLEMLCGCEGFADIRRTLRADARDNVFPHVRLQLEVGALAAAAGHGVRFEPPVPNSQRNSDISIELADKQRLLVEARVLLPDRHTVTQNELTDRALTALQRTASRLDIDCAGDLTRPLQDSELAELLEHVSAHARLARAGGYAPPLQIHGANLQITRRETTTERTLRGPALRGDLWPRIADRLIKKATQTRGAENVWLRFTALQGLWLFTYWGQLELSDKLATMRTNIMHALSGHPHVDGVVLSSALAWPQGTIDPDEHADQNGGYALRVTVPPMMARETLVVPLCLEAGPVAHARAWRDLYAAEPDWPDKVLGRVGLPLVANIFESTA